MFEAGRLSPNNNARKELRIQKPQHHHHHHQRHHRSIKRQGFVPKAPCLETWRRDREDEIRGKDGAARKMAWHRATENRNQIRALIIISSSREQRTGTKQRDNEDEQQRSVPTGTRREQIRARFFGPGIGVWVLLQRLQKGSIGVGFDKANQGNERDREGETEIILRKAISSNYSVTRRLLPRQLSSGSLEHSAILRIFNNSVKVPLTPTFRIGEGSCETGKKGQQQQYHKT